VAAGDVLGIMRTIGEAETSLPVGEDTRARQVRKSFMFCADSPQRFLSHGCASRANRGSEVRALERR
jgi:hypothetical protein